MEEGMESSVVTCSAALKTSNGAAATSAKWPALLETLQQMREREVRNDAMAFTVCVSGHIVRQRWQLAESMLQEMTSSAAELDVAGLNAVLGQLHRCSQWQPAVHLFLEATTTGTLSVDTVSYNSAMSCLAKGGSWQKCIQLLDMMRSSSIKQDVVTVSAAITACTRASQWQVALRLFSEMKNGRMLPDLIAYNSLMAAFADSGLWELSLRLLREMSTTRARADGTTFAAAADACSAAGAWQAAEELLVEMKQRFVRTDGLAEGAVVRALAKAGAWQRAARLLLDGLASSLQLHSSALCAVLSALGGSQPWSAAISLLAEVQKRSQELSVSTLTTAVAACSSQHDDAWPAALDVFYQTAATMDTVDVPLGNAALAALASSAADWDSAMCFFSTLTDSWAQADSVTYASIIAACQVAGKWQRAVVFVERMRGASAASAVAYGAAIAACQQGGCWRAALELLQGFGDAALLADAIAYNAAITCCEKASEWEWAMVLQRTMVTNALQADTVTYNAVASACEKGGEWQLTLGILDEMISARVEPSFVSYSVALSACEAVGQLAVAKQVRERMDEAAVHQPAAARLWALVRTSCTDTGPVDAALTQALQEVRSGRCTSKELATIAWSLSVHGIDEPALVEAVLSQARHRLGRFALHDLMLLVWGLTGCLQTDAVPKHFFEMVTSMLVQRLRSLDAQAVFEFGRQRFLRDIRGLLWSLTFSEQLRPDMEEVAHDLLEAVGRCLDGRPATAASNPGAAASRGSPSALAQANGSEPQIRASFDDRLVVLKPPGWETCDDNKRFQDRQVLGFLKALDSTEGQRPIYEDRDHHFGFLHRLDVPCSGLLLVAKTYEAFYDLTAQLSCGQIVRDYLVLCHGYLPLKAEDQRLERRSDAADLCSSGGEEVLRITARLTWRGNGATKAGRLGKPARTRLKMLALLTSQKQEALSLLAVRIATGRRHQIRSHLAHVGCPSVRDELYTTKSTFLADGGLCDQNWLHRYRLAFRDKDGVERECLEGLPSELVESLAHLTTRIQSATVNLTDMQAGAGLCDWASYRSVGGGRRQ
eukprot:TRINITY_DN62816_c0_g1_i1.p1 TRINITY_DN62816_c0_g1~~TRINITY_DN62816_c0_g1_i1.p1  ORF type:complete len:1056 (-),score=222.46 TRINITY_DN62816_c0_g1_i1:153-3320(-)